MTLWKVLAVALVGGLVFASIAAGAKPAPVGPQCGDTITVDTTLTKNLHCSGGGLQLVGDRITLDLNGHSVEGDGTGGGIFVQPTTPTAALVVKNGTVRGFANGAGGCGAFLNMRVLSNTTDGISFFLCGDTHAPPARLENSVVAHNTRWGVTLGGAIRTQILSNKIVDNGVGIRLTAFSDATVLTGNNISRNKDTGVEDHVSFINYTNNRLVGNGGPGISVDDSDNDGFGYRFTGNVALRNGGVGIYAVLGSVDGGGNVARGNADPQCVNLACQAHASNQADDLADDDLADDLGDDQ